MCVSERRSVCESDCVGERECVLMSGERVCVSERRERVCENKQGKSVCDRETKYVCEGERVYVREIVCGRER